MKVKYLNTKYPIAVYGEVARYESVNEAAKALGRSKSAIKRAVNKRCAMGKNFVLLADMPIECQPINKYRYRKPVIWEGVEYPSISAAAKGDRKLFMRISRARQKAIEQQGHLTPA